ncbi:MAG TPA: YihY/virulence factor BrkB family protein [Stellaceae bacterium]|jgi:membrane protein|nr:YihY/virulence factor BrkB family protein [Stellaceae bacterium]
MPRDRRDRSQSRPTASQILKRVWDEQNRDHVSMMAAGVAFYSLLAMFPGISAAISLYGLFADRADVEHHLQALAGILPGEALQLISDQVHELVSAPPAKLGIGLLLSLAFGLWSAMSGTSMLMQTLTIAYEEEDDRGILDFYGRTFGLTLGMIGFGLIALAVVAGIPTVLGTLPFPAFWRDAVSFSRWPILAGLVLVSLGLLYRLAPYRRRPRWEWLAPGTVAASLLWLVVCAGFSIYVARFGSYDKTYGSIGAVIVLLMWLYLSAYIILIGAELNCEVDRAARQQRHRPTNARDPMPGPAAPV